MKNCKFTIMLFIISSLLFISAAQAPQLAEPEISQFVDLFVKKWNQHDPRELIELWAENGDLMNPAGEWEKGRANVLKNLIKEHRGLLYESQMKQEITNILVLSPTMAWVDAKVSLNVPGIASGLDHHIVYLLVKQNNQWKILAVRPYQFLDLNLGRFE
ncbi:YybH family protein [Criblamydia sequanensis]|uniref:Secreted protein n=1 Tax=Candidatus Criblamydia sequanensis CRIB-18 TaxID=1437425 RepID=A0A090D316_9BACT|nr:DUF4440 domain-containing protein [Criblamydia sequanensis]CDR34833.1 putative secreted protein [Criblamydia sequanensis CRIB-18]